MGVFWYGSVTGEFHEDELVVCSLEEVVGGTGVGDVYLREFGDGWEEAGGHTDHKEGGERD